MVVGDFPLDGQIAVVTGGGSGINLAFVRLALSAGARILIADLKLLPEAAELVDSSDGKVEFTHCDVSDWSHLRSLPSEVQKAFGDDAIATVWIAGAGVFEPPWSDFLHDAETEHYKQLQINTEHPIKLTRIAMRSLLGAGRKGVVLIVASMAGITGSYGAPLYCASKHAVVGFTKSMAQADEDEGVKVREDGKFRSCIVAKNEHRLCAVCRVWSARLSGQVTLPKPKRSSTDTLKMCAFPPRKLRVLWSRWCRRVSSRVAHCSR